MNMPQHTFKTDQETIDLRAYTRGLYIDGQWRQAADGRLIEVVDPSTERVIAEVPDAAMVDVEAAVEAAARASAGWSETPPRKRSEILRRCFELMIQRSETLAALISIENGKALRDARGEVAYAAEFFRWNAEEAVRITGEFGLAPSGANRIIVDYQPIGVCVLITPWNFPAAMATRKIAPALAAGCTVVLKPASETPLTAYALAALYEEAGVPPGVVNVLTVSNPGPPPPPCWRIHGCGNCRSPARPALAAAYSPKRPSTSSHARWNSAATRRSSSSTTPISRLRSTARW
jgi:succinate-semialdehyde dehydrogenase/glutarate-semialdehyde dehydrogenase